MNRDQVEAEVRARQQTPGWAERQAEESGWEPFAKLPVPWSHFDGAGKWPINFVTMWLSFPSPDDAATHWSRLQYWSHHVWRDIPSEDWFPVQQKLSEGLRKGSIQGWGKKNADAPQWSAIPQDEWESFLDWTTDRNFATAALPGKPTRWFDVRVAREDVERLLTADEGVVKDAPAPAEAPIDVDPNPVVNDASVPEVAGAAAKVRVNDDASSKMTPDGRLHMPSAGRPSLAHLYEPEYRRRTRSGEAVGAQREATFLRQWLSEQIGRGEINLDPRVLPSESAIKKNILRWNLEERNRTKTGPK